MSKPESAESQRLRLLFRQSRTASYAALIGATVCTAVFTLGFDIFAALYWWAAVTAVTVMRIRFQQRFFLTAIDRHPESYWLIRNTWQALAVGVSWGALPLVDVTGANSQTLHSLQILVPGFVLMAAISSYGVYHSQYLALWGSMGAATIATRLISTGAQGLPEAMLFALFLPVLLITAKRYGDSLAAAIQAKSRSDHLVSELTATNNQLHHHNAMLAQQQDLLEQEEALARHVFRQLTLGGDHKIPGVHTWNQSMGSLSGDITQTERGPGGQVYVFLADFTGHGLPAALGALPASSVFLAMATKGLPVATIAAELNHKLHQLLPVGYFCCAVLIELEADRRVAHVWNGGLPPVLIHRASGAGFEQITSHSVPLGVLADTEFDAEAHRVDLARGDVLYAYTDGLTEAEDIDGNMLGQQRLEAFLRRDDLDAPKLPALIDAVLEHVNLAPASDDISVVEIEALPDDARARADAAA